MLKDVLSDIMNFGLNKSKSAYTGDIFNYYTVHIISISKDDITYFGRYSFKNGKQASKPILKISEETEIKRFKIVPVTNFYATAVVEL